MAKTEKDILLIREGADQQSRLAEFLSPDSVKLNDFTMKDWMRFAWRFAEHVNYFSTNDHKVPTGNWQDFFIADKDLDIFLSELSEGGDISPHLALFVSFLYLLDYSKSRFNKLTKEHLDFYYQRVLRIEKHPITPDRVHILFELAKSATSVQIPKGTELDGGKDDSGVKRVYRTTNELIASRTTVNELISLYNDQDSEVLRVAEIANSYDGSGGDFPDGKVKWWPFGYYNDSNYPELPSAKVGFALSSKIFELKEGVRDIQITIGCSEIPTINPSSLLDCIEITYSGEEGWVGPLNLSNLLDQSNFETKLVGKELRLAFRIGKELEPVVGYSSSTHELSYSGNNPICRFIINTSTQEGYQLYSGFDSVDIDSVAVKINVREIVNIDLSNDFGPLKPDSTIYPFGSLAPKGAKFFIGYPELHSKSWSNLNLKVVWQNTPASFRNHYIAYKSDFVDEVSAVIFKNKAYAGRTKSSAQTSMLIVSNDSHFTAGVEIYDKKSWKSLFNKTLFAKSGGSFITNLSIQNNSYHVDRDQALRLTLTNSFLHELYPRIYALAISSDDKDLVIPKEPYTPCAERVELGYTAESHAELGGSSEDYEVNPIKLFHEYPYGQAEEHAWLNSAAPFLSDDERKLNLVPQFLHGGELYIGLKDATPQQQVSLLVQVLEGTENPESDIPEEHRPIEWAVLCSNQWQRFDSQSMIVNETDNFLRSGLVRFILPKEATADNTLLPAGLVWLRVRNRRSYDTVCKLIAIHAQAVEAKFVANGDQVPHLANGLKEDTISKLVHRVSQVKGVSQPYSSFGGIPIESDSGYYTRVSERLRHKQRAITLWDYEHIVLQQFPEIHKAKCLNHSNSNSYLSPGDVLLVVIPDIVNRNVFDIFQPRVSKATLNSIQGFINNLNSLHVKARVINPEYEEVQVNLTVKFNKGCDDSYYRRVLNNDIIRLLSPWAFDNKQPIRFGSTLHRSTLINYIEKLEYIDFVLSLKLKQKTLANPNFTEVKIASPSNPKAILVSAKGHNVNTSTVSCAKANKSEERCQK